MTALITTEIELCTGCNKCIMVCPIKYANIVKIVDGKRIVIVDEDRCVSCGKCIQVCNHNARGFLDDSKRFWQDLQNGQNITVMIAPSFVANQPIEYKRVLGFLKSKGVKTVFDVSLGADISSWGYVQYFKRGKQKDFVISQPCPALVDYIEKYTPELMEYLIPSQSPVMCAATYLKKYQKDTNKLALISPCISKKLEIEKSTNNRMIEYNITFNSLYKYFEENNINLADYPECEYESAPSGLGMQFSKPGGLKDNVKYHLPNLKIKQIEGPEKVYEFLNYINNGNSIGSCDLLDLLSCTSGCNIGPAACAEKEIDYAESSFNEELLHQIRLENQLNREIDYKKYDELFKYFDENFDYKDFMIDYENQSKKIKTIYPELKNLEKVFQKLRKDTEELRHINCYSCGYKSCKDMAIAIYNGYNVPESCYVYNQKELEFQKNIFEENENYIRTILEHLTESVIVTDKNGKIEFVNQETASIFCEVLKDYLNKNIKDYIPDINISKMEEMTCYEFAVSNCEFEHKKKILKLEFSSIEINNKKHLIFIIEDITTEKELDTMKNNFVSVISHELRTPLTSIRGALGLIASGALGQLPVKANDLVAIANSNSLRLINLINDILDIQKIRAGKISFDFEILNVKELLMETVKLNNEYAKQYSVEYKIIDDYPDLNIKVDKNRFIQVLTNLLSNAAKFSYPETNIDISYKNENDNVIISVTNKGRGIPAEAQPRIFESFYQVDSSDARIKGGTGLGLSIARELTKNMNGNMYFKSIENKSTTFFCSFEKI